MFIQQDTSESTLGRCIPVCHFKHFQIVLPLQGSLIPTYCTVAKAKRWFPQKYYQNLDSTTGNKSFSYFVFFFNFFYLNTVNEKEGAGRCNGASSWTV